MSHKQPRISLRDAQPAADAYPNHESNTMLRNHPAGGDTAILSPIIMLSNLRDLKPLDH